MDEGRWKSVDEKKQELVMMMERPRNSFLPIWLFSLVGPRSNSILDHLPKC